MIELPADTSKLIMNLIPQKYPLLMIDTIKKYSYKKSAVCTKNITFGEEIFVGHFPNNPIYPGVLLIEMGLQTTHIMLTPEEDVINGVLSTGPQGLVLKVDKFKFYKTSRPGDVLTIKSTFDTEILNITKVKVVITNDKSERIATGRLTVGTELKSNKEET